MTCTATDDCGNSSSCDFNVTVDAVNVWAVTVEISLNIEPPGTLTRRIKFELWGARLRRGDFRGEQHPGAGRQR